MSPIAIIPHSEAVSTIPAPDGNGKPITVIATEAIRRGFDEKCLQQAVNTASAPGVSELVINPDAHAGYGAPIGSVLVSPTHIFPGPVGVDMKCSMSLLQLNIPVEEMHDRPLRRELINAICERIPTGPGKGQRSVRKSHHVSAADGKRAIIEGASASVCEALGIPSAWAARCEDSHHLGHDGSRHALEHRVERLLAEEVIRNWDEKLAQLGSYGGGNHFGECNAVTVEPDARSRETANVFGLKSGQISFLSHCGSRGFGNVLATQQFKKLLQYFQRHNIPLPAGDRELVYAPLESDEANEYLDDLALAANFATINHLLINALVLEAFQEVMPGAKGELVYFISHNIARREELDGCPVWVHRKGATRAFPGGHPGLAGTPFAATGHPILLPGNPKAGSVVMVAEPGARLSCYSVNHGAGRAMGRNAAKKLLDQKEIDRDFERCDILSNCRKYPIDEAPAAYKDFNEVLRSVEKAGLARTVARLSARFVIKDGSSPDD